MTDDQNGVTDATGHRYRSFIQAREFARNLQLKSRKDWRDYVRGLRGSELPRPEDIPAHPDGVYKTRGWQGWRNWLGTEPTFGNLPVNSLAASTLASSIAPGLAQVVLQNGADVHEATSI